MVEIVDEIFALSGLSSDWVPSTLAELIPWCVRITVGTVAVSGAFAFLGKLTDIFQIWRWR